MRLEKLVIPSIFDSGYFKVLFPSGGRALYIPGLGLGVSEPRQEPNDASGALRRLGGGLDVSVWHCWGHKDMSYHMVLLLTSRRECG